MTKMHAFNRKTVLVTGALGYIGSHTVVELLLSGLNIDVLAVDNLSNSSIDVLEHIHQTVAAQCSDVLQSSIGRLDFVQADVTDWEAMRKLFARSYSHGRPIDSVIHFAALKSVSESLEQPGRYYRENVGGLISLLSTMKSWDCNEIIFSSSATVYGSLGGNSKCTESLCRHSEEENDKIGIQGSAGLANPYARTKWMCEAMLHDQCVSDSALQAIALRYFNPVGAHPTGVLRESPKGRPTNLFPSVTLAMKEGVEVRIFGTDYDTVDGSAVRDYIHVVDLAKGHVAALQRLWRTKSTPQKSEFPWHNTTVLSSPPHSPSDSDASSTHSLQTSSPTQPDTPPTPYSPHHWAQTEDLSTSIPGLEEEKRNALIVYNLGTGQGSTVKEVLAAMRVASGHSIPAREEARREGDIAFSVADPSRANKELAWCTQFTLQDACRDTCNSLQSSHP